MKMMQQIIRFKLQEINQILITNLSYLPYNALQQ